MEAVDGAGAVIPLDDAALKKKIYPTRLRFLYYALLNVRDPSERNERLKALWRVWAGNNPKLREARTVRFYRATYSLLPEKLRENPVARELLFEWENPEY
jgi:hypothetical protein